MVWLEPIHHYIENLERRRLYQLMAGVLGAIVLLVGLVIYIRYSYVDDARARLNDINEQREQVKNIVTEAERVKKQRAEVDAMLAKEPDFKITGYVNEVLKKLRLIDKLTTSEYSQGQDLENGYRESIRKITLTGMNMKELAELLKTFEQNERIYTKELEIARSSRQPQTIDVMLAVATLEPRTAVTE